MSMDLANDIEIRIEDAAAEQIVHVKGAISLLTAGKLQTVFLDALRPGARTVLDGRDIEAVDLSGLQLLCAAHRTYLSHLACFEIRGRSETLKAAADAAGYSACDSVCRHRGEHNCLWKW